MTLWLYIKEMVNTSSPKFFYGAVSVAYLLSSAFLTPVIGRVVDRTRVVRVTFLVCNSFLIVGNILYSLHFSPWLLVAGRFLSGCDGLNSVMCGELIRSYPSSETTFQLSILSITFNSGFILGPGLNFMFSNIDFYLGHWHIKNVNFIGVFMTFVCIIMEILCLTMIHDLSKEFDLKQNEEKNAKAPKIEALGELQELNFESLNYMNSNLCEEFNQALPSFSLEEMESQKEIANSSSTHISIFKILKFLFTSFDSSLILFCTFFVIFFLVTFDMWLPLLVIETLHLSILELNICVFGAGATTVLILLLYLCKPVSDEKVFVAVLIGLLGLCTVNVAFIVLTNNSSKALALCFGIIYMVCFAGAGIIPDVFLTNTLASLVNSNEQAFVDGIRNWMHSAGALLGFSSAVFTFNYIEVFASLYIALTLIFVILLMARRKSLLNSKPIF